MSQFLAMVGNGVYMHSACHLVSQQNSSKILNQFIFSFELNGCNTFYNEVMGVLPTLFLHPTQNFEIPIKRH